MNLTVTNPFAGFKLGEVITDPDAVKAVLAGEHSGHVVATQSTDADQPRKRKE